jgi:hypothetical protein
MMSSQQHSRVPRFAHEQEDAELWDTHSPLDFPDEIEEVELSVAQRIRKRGLTVKLDQSTIDQLDTIARQQGIGPSTVARMWILDRLRSLPPDSAPGKAS